MWLPCSVANIAWRRKIRQVISARVGNARKRELKITPTPLPSSLAIYHIRLSRHKNQKSSGLSLLAGK